jgi:hypothetical protein
MDGWMDGWIVRAQDTFFIGFFVPQLQPPHTPRVLKMGFIQLDGFKMGKW